MLPIIYPNASPYRKHKRGELFQSLTRPMKDKLSGWDKRFLIFWSCLTWSRTLCPYDITLDLDHLACIVQELKHCMARFFWDIYRTQHKSHWVTWITICHPVAVRGLCLRPIVLPLSLPSHCRILLWHIWAPPCGLASTPRGPSIKIGLMEFVLSLSGLTCRISPLEISTISSQL